MTRNALAEKTFQINFRYLEMFGDSRECPINSRQIHANPGEDVLLTIVSGYVNLSTNVQRLDTIFCLICIDTTRNKVYKVALLLCFQ